jgi:hypothetical protein
MRGEAFMLQAGQLVSQCRVRLAARLGTQEAKYTPNELSSTPVNRQKVEDKKERGERH